MLKILSNQSSVIDTLTIDSENTSFKSQVHYEDFKDLDLSGIRSLTTKKVEAGALEMIMDLAGLLLSDMT
ncbi:hypothetical protein CPB86DRAFT_58269 [Serendipita vermifera]|nr:hypothetical protein CPB86DRAFT_58269 [Serendipita vermifera]